VNLPAVAAFSATCNRNGACSVQTLMPLLEARFHPQKKDGEVVVVVGRVRCEGSQADIEPIRNGEMLEQLRYLVRESEPEPYEGLGARRSKFWSSVEINEGGTS